MLKRHNMAKQYFIAVLDFCLVLNKNSLIKKGLKKTGKKEGMLWLWQEGEFYKGLKRDMIHLTQSQTFIITMSDSSSDSDDEKPSTKNLPLINGLSKFVEQYETTANLNQLEA
ncbi:hypothetical protein ACJX0J_010252, partial [Zea mays]